jgi:hypothetical protein
MAKKPSASRTPAPAEHVVALTRISDLVLKGAPPGRGARALRAGGFQL